MREAAVGMPAYFQVVAQDEGSGVPPASSFSVSISGATVSQCKARGNIYPFMYVPQQPGIAKIHVKYLNVDLVNTPFSASVADSPRGFFDTSLGQCKVRGRGLVRAVQNSTATFFIEARDAAGNLVRWCSY